MAQTITVQGTNLIQVAAQYLGMPEAWPQLAALNGLTDFILPPGIIQLVLPDPQSLNRYATP